MHGWIKEWKGAEKQGQPGQLALKSWWACPTNRQRLFSQLCSEHLQGWPGTPCRAWERVVSQDTRQHIVSPALPDTQTEKTHNSLSKQPRTLPARFPCSLWPRCQGPGPGLSPRWGGGVDVKRREPECSRGSQPGLYLKRPCQTH